VLLKVCFHDKDYIFSSEAEICFLFYKISERMVCRLLSVVVMLFVSYAVYSLYYRGNITEGELT